MVVGISGVGQGVSELLQTVYTKPKGLLRFCRSFEVNNNNDDNDNNN